MLANFSDMLSVYLSLEYVVSDYITQVLLLYLYRLN